jgi:hypothetical protein
LSFGCENFSRKRKITGIDVACCGGVACSQILRRNENALDPAAKRRKAQPSKRSDQAGHGFDGGSSQGKFRHASDATASFACHMALPRLIDFTIGILIPNAVKGPN